MNYIVFDLELNSKPFKNRHPNEIIEIGAVKMDESLNCVDQFQSFIEPRVYKKLFSIVKQKTNISQEDINGADNLKSVLTRFKQWIGGDYVLCTWGQDDIHHLKTNCSFNRIGSKWIKKCINVQKQFSKIYSLPLGQTHSLKNALKLLDIPVGDNLHRALADAEYTAMIFRKIFEKIDLDLD